MKVLAAGAMALALAGCQTTDGVAQREEAKGGITNSSSFGSGPEEVWLQKAKNYYRNGNYGLAERYYRQAIEERHSNPEAWLGLAASYDRLKRYDLAERAYKQLLEITGPTPTVLNNIAYHKMLRGDFVAARETLDKAEAKAPGNPYIRNNRDLLDRWEAQAGTSAT